MQSDLIIKENELIDPSDYPEDQHGLVEDFNARIQRLTGIITGIGKEYLTIWVINANTKKMYLYRSTGENTNRYAVELGLRFDNYDRFIEEYVDRCVVNSIESIQRDVKLDVVFSRIKDGVCFHLIICAWLTTGICPIIRWLSLWPDNPEKRRISFWLSGILTDPSASTLPISAI
ncbi:MAG: hypothetical protein K6E49_09660 [Lachnospiraceae bacterium]|nr:hypothetical protein [Lachnospiraceae bacterium]